MECTVIFSLVFFFVYLCFFIEDKEYEEVEDKKEMTKKMTMNTFGPAVFSFLFLHLL